MIKFCSDLLKFLKSKYNDAYDFELIRTVSLDSDELVLKIKLSHNATFVIDELYMNKIFLLYQHPTYDYKRSIYKWQKELIDIIEKS